jgi:hypothetical protein
VVSNIIIQTLLATIMGNYVIPPVWSTSFWLR